MINYYLTKKKAEKGGGDKQEQGGNLCIVHNKQNETNEIMQIMQQDRDDIIQVVFRSLVSVVFLVVGPPTSNPYCR